MSVLALIFLAIFSALGVAYATFASGTLTQGKNHARGVTARFQAESGLSFLLNEVCKVSLPGGASGDRLLAAVAIDLQAQLNGSANLGGATVAYDEDARTITIPSILTDQGSFDARITLVDDSSIRLTVTGRSDEAKRTVAIDCMAVAGGAGVFDYGVAAGGKIRMTGNASILGANNPGEANILSTATDTDEAFKLTGNCEIAGDISASNAAAYATLTGNVSIGGESIWSGDINDHIHIGIGEVEFPEVDPNVFEPFATNLVTASTNTSGNKTFTNIRVVAGADKTFSGNITLNGVTFIEAPNQIHFSGNVTITGVIVTQDAGDNVYETNTIKFTGNTTSRGVDQLPDTPEFAGLREMTGSFLLAPGFGLEFAGNFGTVNGALAADRFKWTGNAGGTVRGPVISYSNAEFVLTGNSNLTIDRATTPALPTGFVLPLAMTPNVDTYTEY